MPKPFLIFLPLFLLLGCQSPTTDSPDSFTIQSVLHHDLALHRAHDVELSGNLAFVPGKGGSLAIIDIANPAAPKILWYRHDPEYLTDSETVMPIGDHLLLGTNDFFSLDITNPTTPANPTAPTFLKKIITRPDSRIKGIAKRGESSRINGFAKRGDYVLAANKSGWIDVFDISNLDAPRHFGGLNVRQAHDLMDPHDIDIFSNYAVIVDPRRFGQHPTGKLAVFRIANPTTPATPATPTTPVTNTILPVEQWTLAGLIEDPKLMGANRVQISGHFAYVGGSLSLETRQKLGPTAYSRLNVIDLSNPSTPNIVASIPFTSARGPNGLTIAGEVLFLAGGQTIEAIDISNPRHPVKIASIRIPLRIAFDEPTDSLHDLIYRNGYLYVSGQSDNTFIILKVNDQRILNLARGK